MKISIPYGKGTMEAEIPDQYLSGVIKDNMNFTTQLLSEEEQVDEALENPIGSCQLCKLAEQAKNVVIICSDHTRPVPSKILIPKMLREIRRGNPDAKITLLIATGCHRGMTKEELIEKFGEQIAAQEHIVMHQAEQTEDHVSIGTLPSGGDLQINRIAAEADLLVAEGFIEPHFFAGYSGGRKSVLPGVASAVTVRANHCSKFIASPYARYGSLEFNPMHIDMVYAARKAKLAFILNVVINPEKKIIGAFAGDCIEAHAVGCAYLDKHCRCNPNYADIVVVSNNGYPLDQNLYQTVKGMAAAEETCNPGGVIIMVAECEDGLGGDSFYQSIKDSDSLEGLMEKFLSTQPSDTIPDQWQTQIFLRILMKYSVVLISSLEPQLVRDMHLIPAGNMEEALNLAKKTLGRNGTITVIPEGISNIIGMKQ